MTCSQRCPGIVPGAARRSHTPTAAAYATTLRRIPYARAWSRRRCPSALDIGAGQSPAGRWASLPTMGESVSAVQLPDGRHGREINWGSSHRRSGNIAVEALWRVNTLHRPLPALGGGEVSDNIPLPDMITS